MKICIISYDYWGYDGHIAHQLQQMGVQAHHINLSAVGHKNTIARAKNALSKIFLKKNLKEENRLKFLDQRLRDIGGQDQVLVINPELIDERYHKKIRAQTNKYIAYLYDSTARCPVDHLLQYFDEVFSFDPEDSKKYGFTPMTNYNYLSEEKAAKPTETDAIYVGSLDQRVEKLYGLAQGLYVLNKHYRFYIVGKTAWKKKLHPSKGFIFRIQAIPPRNLPDYYRTSRVIVDLVRAHQNGLSFRFFEAMALKKKIITNNVHVKDYDFYHPDNIKILGEDVINNNFFESPYRELDEEVYKKYTLENWVKTIFALY